MKIMSQCKKVINSVVAQLVHLQVLFEEKPFRIFFRVLKCYLYIGVNVNVYYSLNSSKTHVTDFVPGVLWCVLRHLDGTQLRPVTQLDLLFGLDKMRESKQATVTADPTNLREVPLD